MSFEVSKMSFKSNFSDNIADGKDIHGFATMTKLKKSIFEAKMKPNKKVRQMKAGQINCKQNFLFFTDWPKLVD